jgi:hypothetical protein
MSYRGLKALWNKQYSLCILSFSLGFVIVRLRTATSLSLQFGDARHDMIRPPYSESLGELSPGGREGEIT